jgi:hypothetical protein
VMKKNCVLVVCFDTREFFSKAEFFFLSHESARVWASDGSARGCPRNGESVPATLCISLNRDCTAISDSIGDNKLQWSHKETSEHELVPN